MARVDLVVCFSGNQRDILWQRLGIPKERIVVVPFGAETDFFCPDQVVEGGYVFAAGGDRGRDYLTLAAAVSDRPIPLQVVGWRFTTERINWGPAVEVTGVIDHLDYRRRLASSSVVVVPSYPLAYPSGQSVLVEAMAMGKACVATESPPLRDYIDHGRNGLLVPPGDPEALRRAMQKLLADRQLRRDLGREASMDVVKRFNRESMWSKIALAMKDL